MRDINFGLLPSRKMDRGIYLHALVHHSLSVVIINRLEKIGAFMVLSGRKVSLLLYKFSLFTIFFIINIM